MVNLAKSKVNLYPGRIGITDVGVTYEFRKRQNQNNNKTAF